jgi:AraC family transcriptional regulator of arabinose operon
MTHYKTCYAALEVLSIPQIHRCEAAWRWDVAAMPDHDLWCVLSGRGELSIDGQRHSLGPGSCWLIEPGSRCEATHDTTHRLRVFSLHFTLLSPNGEPRPLGADERPHAGAIVADRSLLEALSRGCVESGQQSSVLGRLQVELYLRQLLLLLLQSSQGERAAVVDPRIAAVLQAVQEEPGRAWSVPMMARQAHLSRSQLTRGFKAATDRAPMQCVLEARMARACNLLRETRLQIGEIADLLGYRDIYYFSRQFKEMIGVAPTHYRARPASSIKR